MLIRTDLLEARINAYPVTEIHLCYLSPSHKIKRLINDSIQAFTPIVNNSHLIHEQK